jgi:hypothetical protein
MRGVRAAAGCSGLQRAASRIQGSFRAPTNLPLPRACLPSQRRARCRAGAGQGVQGRAPAARAPCFLAPESTAGRHSTPRAARRTLRITTFQAAPRSPRRARRAMHPAMPRRAPCQTWQRIRARYTWRRCDAAAGKGASARPSGALPRLGGGGGGGGGGGAAGAGGALARGRAWAPAGQGCVAGWDGRRGACSCELCVRGSWLAVRCELREGWGVCTAADRRSSCPCTAR